MFEYYADVPLVIFDDRDTLPDFYKIIAMRNRGTKVILIGNRDHKLKIEQIKCINIQDYPEYSIQVQQFDRTYVHRSTNSPIMEKACFHRFLALAIVMKNLDLKYAWNLDTDVWYSQGLNVISQDLIKREIDFCGSSDKNMMTSVNGGCSFFSIKAANSLAGYILNSFENKNTYNLNKLYEEHISNNLTGGICDMTAIAYWLKDNKNISAENSFGKEIGGLYINHNLISLIEELGAKGIQSIKRRTDRSHLTVRASGHNYRYAALHFGGHSKNYIYILKYSKLIFRPFALNQMQMRITRKIKSKSLFRSL